MLFRHGQTRNLKPETRNQKPETQFRIHQVLFRTFTLDINYRIILCIYLKNNFWQKRIAPVKTP